MTRRCGWLWFRQVQEQKGAEVLRHQRILELLPEDWTVGYASGNHEVLVCGGRPGVPGVDFRVRTFTVAGRDHRGALALILARFLASFHHGRVLADGAVLAESGDLSEPELWTGYLQPWRTVSTESGAVLVVNGYVHDPRGLLEIRQAVYRAGTFLDDLALLVAEVLDAMAREALAVRLRHACGFGSVPRGGGKHRA